MIAALRFCERALSFSLIVPSNFLTDILGSLWFIKRLVDAGPASFSARQLKITQTLRCVCGSSTPAISVCERTELISYCLAFKQQWIRDDHSPRQQCHLSSNTISCRFLTRLTPTTLTATELAIYYNGYSLMCERRRCSSGNI